MRVLFTMTPAFNPNDGGVQRTTYKLGKYFTEVGIEVSYFSFALNGHVDVEYGTLYHAIETGKNKNRANIDYLERCLLEIEPDIVINQMPYEQEISDCLYKNKKIISYKLLGCLRNSLFNFKSNARDRMEQNLPPLLFKLLDNKLGIELVQLRHKIKHRGQLRRILDVHDLYILLTPPNREELDFFVDGYKSEKVIVIPNSIPEVVNVNLIQKEKIILHVGRINISQKRSDLIIPLWNEIKDKIPEWKFLIVGDGPYFETLKNQIEDVSMERIELVGYAKPEKYYQRASIYSMFSANEGFPNTILEAQSYGCVPFAYNSYAALSWIVHHKKNGYIIPAYDVKKMGSEILNLIEKKEDLIAMQKDAQDNAGKFVIEKVGKEWLNLFQSLLH